jgi:hypothetical protein
VGSGGGADGSGRPDRGDGDGERNGTGGRDGGPRDDLGPPRPRQVDARLNQREQALPTLKRREREATRKALVERHLIAFPDSDLPVAGQLWHRHQAAAQLRVAGDLRSALGRYSDAELAFAESQKILWDALDLALKRPSGPEGAERAASAHAELAIELATRGQWRSRDRWDSAFGQLRAAQNLFDAAEGRGHLDPPALRAAQGRYLRRFAEAALDGGEPRAAADLLNGVLLAGWLPRADPFENRNPEALLAARALLVADLRNGDRSLSDAIGTATEIADRFLMIGQRGQAAGTLLVVSEHAFDTAEPSPDRVSPRTGRDPRRVGIGHECLALATNRLRGVAPSERTLGEQRYLEERDPPVDPSTLDPYVSGYLTWFGATVPRLPGEAPLGRRAVRGALRTALRQFDRAEAPEAGVVYDLLYETAHSGEWRGTSDAQRGAISLGRLSEASKPGLLAA